MTDPGFHRIDAQSFVLHFPSLFDAGRGFAFPCNAHGAVDLATLSPRARENYLAARDAVGRDLGVPAVVAQALH